MPDPDPVAPMPRPAEPPGWLDAPTLRAVEAACRRRFARGGTARDAARDAREVVLAHHPALPLALIAEAVAAAVPDPRGRPGGPDSAPPSGQVLVPAAPEQVAETPAHALRFGDAGEERPGGAACPAPVAAVRLVRRLALSGWVVCRRAAAAARR